MASRRNKLMDLLLRGGERAEERAVDDPALTSAHTRARQALAELVPVTERLAGAVAHARGTVEALSERERRGLASRAELSAATARVRDGLDRLGIVALNAGLEGARLEGPAGRALAMVADEIRQVAMRCMASTDEVDEALHAARTEADKAHVALGETRERLATAAIEASSGVALAHAADGALSDLGDRLGKATGVDPEVAAALERAQTHARELVSALSLASSRGLVRGAALRPVLEPILRLFDQLDTDRDAEDE
ncbi:MAG: hypothetical protein IT374_04565 [Polyangiaceae bacterium]|nr:hypothetical protein [Polyangiaceae bacterium]